MYKIAFKINTMKHIEKLTIVGIAKTASAQPLQLSNVYREEDNEPNYGRGALYGGGIGAGIGGLIHLLGSLWRGDNPLSLDMLTALLSGGGIGAVTGAGASHAKPGWMNSIDPNNQGGGLVDKIKNIDWDEILAHVKGEGGPTMLGPNVDPSGQNKWDRAGLPTPGGNIEPIEPIEPTETPEDTLK